MINVHILGNGTLMYAIRTLLEVNQTQFKDDIRVNCFGDFYFSRSMVYALNNYLTVEDVVSQADIVICTDPKFEDDDIVALCAEQSKPLFCTFLLENKKPYKNSLILDGLNVENAASDLWINRILDVTENVVEIEHYYGLSKLYETGDNALPGITAEEYREATQHVDGQPRLVWLGASNRYFYAQEIFEEKEDDVTVSYNWLIDTDHIDASKIDLQTEFLFHTVTKINDGSQTTLKRSHMTCQDNRTIAAWFYINACVVSSFVYMYHHNQCPTNCQDYNLIDHSIFSDNIFGARFRVA